MKRLFLTLLLLAGIQTAADPSIPTADPCLQVDCPSPTADKPQSKLWFMDGRWWAVLPRTSGPSLWERTDAGWREHPEVARDLRGVPGRADVWPDPGGVTAVARAELDKTNRSVTVFRLIQKSGSSETQWESRVLTELLPPSPDDAIETVTLVRDSAGTVWVAAVAGVKVCVWASSPGEEAWSGPTVLAEGIKEDDICVVTPLPGNQIGVLWSDQLREAVLMRAHTDGRPVDQWLREEVAEIGNRTADDHLNTVLTSDGTLWVANKNEVDKTGKPQFVLRVRSADGQWSNEPYGIRGKSTRPSRPIVVADGGPSAVFTGYGDNDRALPSPHGARIVFSRVELTSPYAVSSPQPVIAPAEVHRSNVHNVTGPRMPFPADAPWIVLASDSQGHVYEADLRAAFRDAAPRP